jgi:magnesium chelatase family protein
VRNDRSSINMGDVPAILAAGGGHILMLDSPGSRKTTQLRRLPTLLPPLTPSESLEISWIYWCDASASAR